MTLPLRLDDAERPVLRFTVYGRAAPAGSKKAVPFGGKKGAKRWGVTDASKRSKPWKNDVAQHVGEAMEGRELLRGALAVTFRFFVARPKGHFTTTGKLSAAGRRQPFPSVRPDLLKLARAVEDALTGIVYDDDARIVDEVLQKRYGDTERVEIEIEELCP